jgi:hypothetical protein
VSLNRPEINKISMWKVAKLVTKYVFSIYPSKVCAPLSSDDMWKHTSKYFKKISEVSLTHKISLLHLHIIVDSQ